MKRVVWVLALIFVFSGCSVLDIGKMRGFSYGMDHMVYPLTTDSLRIHVWNDTGKKLYVYENFILERFDNGNWVEVLQNEPTGKQMRVLKHDHDEWFTVYLRKDKHSYTAGKYRLKSRVYGKKMLGGKDFDDIAKEFTLE